jgi:DNA-binding NarL/FixJ family response regulator
MPVKILLFDDNPRILDAFAELFAEIGDFQLTGGFLTTEHLQTLVTNHQPDVVLMDIHIPPVDGIEATRIIMQHDPSVKVIIQTIFEEDEKVLAALCAGASGYLLKNASPDSMVRAIREIMEGGMPMSPAIAARVLAVFRSGLVQVPRTLQADEYQLSSREKEILKFLVEGFSYKMVADRCRISYETVKSHIKKIYSKMQVASMTEAVAKAILEKLV